MCSTCASGTTAVSREVTVVLPAPLRPSTAMIPGRSAGRPRTARTRSAKARAPSAYQADTCGSSGWSAMGPGSGRGRRRAADAAEAAGPEGVA